MKILVFFALAFFVSSCSDSRSDQFDNVDGNMNRITTETFKFQDGEQIDIKIVNDDIADVHSESYKKLKDFMDDNPNFILYYSGNDEVGLLSKDTKTLESYLVKNPSKNVSDNSKEVINLDCAGWYKLYDSNNFTNILRDETTNSFKPNEEISNLGNIGISMKISSVILTNSRITLYTENNFNMTSFSWSNPVLMIDATGTRVEKDLSTIRLWPKRSNYGSFNWSNNSKSFKSEYKCYIH